MLRPWKLGLDIGLTIMRPAIVALLNLAGFAFRIAGLVQGIWALGTDSCMPLPGCTIVLVLWVKRCV
jgi:hypothetical protein